MQYVALLLLVLSMQHLCAMDMHTMQSALRNSAQFAQQAARNMSPEALAAIRQSSSSVLPHSALASAIRFAAIRHAASMGLQQEARFEHTMWGGAKTGLYYSGKGLYYGGEALLKVIAHMGKVVLAWASAGLLSLVGLGGIVAGGVFLYKGVGRRLGNIETTQQTHGQQLTAILTTQGQHGETLSVLANGQQEQREQLNTIARTQTDHTVSLGVLTKGQQEQREKFDDFEQALDNVASDLGAVNQNLNDFRQETGKEFSGMNEFIATALEKIEALEGQLNDLGVAHSEQNKEHLRELTQLRNEVSSGNANAIDRIKELESAIRVAGETMQTELTQLKALANKNQTELLVAIERRQLMPASSSQAPLLIKEVSPPRGRSPVPSGIQNHTRRSQSPTAKLPKTDSSYIDLPFGKNDYMKALNEHGSLFPRHKGSSSRLLGITHQG
jgi:hypothetical protein